MPEKAIAAGITAAGGLLGGHMSNKANKKAMDTQSKANADALAYQKEQDAKAEAQWNAEQERLAPLRQLKEQMAMQTARRLGIDIGGMNFGPKPYQRGQMAAQGPQGRSIAELSGYQTEDDPMLATTIRDVAQGKWGSRGAY